MNDELTKPFDGKELKFFPVAKSRDGKSARVGSYIDARAVMDRLDAVMGMGGWSTAYRCIDPADKAVECTLSLFIDGAWVAKSDVGYPNEARDADNPDKEPWKAAYSDSLKRAAVQWGIGRYIYSLELERDWLPIDEYGRFTEQPRVKSSQVAAPPRPPSTPVPPKPAGPKPNFLEFMAELGFSADEVEAKSQEFFNNRSVKDLNPTEKLRLQVALESARKKEPARA